MCSPYPVKRIMEHNNFYTHIFYKYLHFCLPACLPWLTSEPSPAKEKGKREIEREREGSREEAVLEVGST